MFRISGQFDKLLDKATSHMLMEPDWPTILQLCDLIRQNDVQPRHALASIKKKLVSTNQHTALYALLTLESMAKNCGTVVHEELTTRSYCEFFYELAKTTPHETVRQKLLELIQAWNFAFRKNPKYQAIKDIMGNMKADGFKFPAFRESDAMFSADTAPEWTDGQSCHRCRVQFSLILRKHHCRACGQVFCGQCTQKTCTLPKYGIEKEVRVCDSCYEQATRPSTSKSLSDKDDLPAEYLNSSLAQQSQAPPPRKTDEELREEEELQLALAISRSEAEAKEKEKYKLVNTFKTPVERSPSPVPVQEEQTNPELARYLNRSYWESINQNESSNDVRVASPSAPANNEIKTKVKQENGVVDNDLEDFIKTLKSQVEIFINRMKSNSSRGRSISNDTSVQTLFMNITAMHSKLLRYIQQHDDSRLHYERLQDKLNQVKDARAALDDLREEHREKLRREAEEAERQRQLQMAQKLEIMRKKKQEYLQYQRQLALQRVQEQEREMQMRQEHQKQQYLMGYMGSNQYPHPPNSAPQPYGYSPYHAQPMMAQPPPQSAPPQMVYQPMPANYGMRPMPNQPMPGIPGMLPPQQTPGMGHIPSNPVMPPQQNPPGLPQVNPQQNHGLPMPPTQGMGLPPPQPSTNPGMVQMPQQTPGMPSNSQMMMQNNGATAVTVPQSPQQQQQPPPPQQQQTGETGETQTAELISFD